MTGLLAIKPLVTDVPGLAVQALRLELDLTPKAGLVDRANSGAHRDMDYALFIKSIAAITPWFYLFEMAGKQYASRPASDQLRLLRTQGIACEQEMYAATSGINTHKGGIFTLGLLSFASGRLQGLNRSVTAPALCQQVSEICSGLVERELAGRTQAFTAGEKQYRLFGLTGVRGEVEQGFATVRQAVLPFWQQEQGERQLHNALLRLMAVTQDSNLVARGGIHGLRFVQSYARRLLATGWDKEALRKMDAVFTARHLSPGGSADLLAVSYILAELPA